MNKTLGHGSRVLSPEGCTEQLPAVKGKSQNQLNPAQDSRRWDLRSTLILVLIGTSPFLWRYDSEIQGIKFDPIDIFFVFLFILGAMSSLSEVPHFRLWILYGSLLSAAYISGWVSELNQLTDPVRIVYQLYKYCWRYLLFYPLVWIFFQEEHRLRRLVFTMVLLADILALIYMHSARSGLLPELGLSKNGIGGFLILPGFLALSLGLYGSTLREKLFYRSSLFVHIVALWYVQSRGAVMAFFVGLICFGLVDGFLYRKKGLVTLMLGSLLIVTTILVVKPDFGEKSGIKGSYTGLVEDPTQVNTFQWRLKHRWPYFLEKVLSNPFLGVGEGSDRSLGKTGNTPHNGYLELAVTSGIPSLVVFLTFITIAMRKTLSVLKNCKDDFGSRLAIGMLCGMVAICIANIVDGHFLNRWVQPWIWVSISLSVVLAAKSTPRSSH